MISDFNNMDGGQAHEDKIKKMIAKKLTDAGISPDSFSLEFYPNGGPSNYATQDNLDDHARAMLKITETMQDLSYDMSDTVRSMINLELKIKMQEAQQKMMLDIIEMVNKEINYLKLPWYKKLFTSKKPNGK